MNVGMTSLYCISSELSLFWFIAWSTKKADVGTRVVPELIPCSGADSIEKSFYISLRIAEMVQDLSGKSNHWFVPLLATVIRWTGEICVHRYLRDRIHQWLSHQICHEIGMLEHFHGWYLFYHFIIRPWVYCYMEHTRRSSWTSPHMHEDFFAIIRRLINLPQDMQIEMHGAFYKVAPLRWL